MGDKTYINKAGTFSSYIFTHSVCRAFAKAHQSIFTKLVMSEKTSHVKMLEGLKVSALRVNSKGLLIIFQQSANGLSDKSPRL